MQVLKSSFFRKFSPYFLKIPIFYAARWRQGGGKVPLPGAHANAPPGGVRATSTGKASVGRQSHLCGAQLRPNCHLRGAQQARSAPERRQGAAAGCAPQCPYGGRAGCRYRQALVGRQSLLRGAQIRPHRYLRGAQQARSAPRTNVRALLAAASNEER